MADKCVCNKGSTLIFACSGGSDVAELSDRCARKLAKDCKGKMYCLAGLGAGIPNMIETARNADNIIVIDGCPVACAKRIMQNNGLKAFCYNLKDMGFEKGQTIVDDDSIANVINNICK